jgi:hypothetical protein
MGSVLWIRPIGIDALKFGRRAGPHLVQILSTSGQVLKEAEVGQKVISLKRAH